MKKLYSAVSLALFLVFCIFSCSKPNVRSRPVVDPPFNGKVIKDIIYGSNIDYFGVKQDLDMDIYQPSEIVDGTVDKLPLLVFVHGGGFLVGTKEGGKGLMERMATKGFISATINYRLGWDRNRDTTDRCSGDSTQLKLAIYRAIQDLRASLRFLTANAGKYNIDTNWIFICGSSAGGVTILNSTYVTQEMADIFLPGVSDTMGLLDRATNSLTNTYTVKALGSMWGGLNTDSIINPLNAKPTIFFHGELDNVVPYDTGTVYQCPDELPVYGSRPIYNKLRSLNVPAIGHIDPQGGHGVYDDDFISDNMACFFNSLMNNTSTSGFYYNKDGSCN